MMLRTYTFIVFTIFYNLHMNQYFESNPTPAFPCPRCKKQAQWTGNSFRPFCSERCKMIDLGAWANEDYRVPLSDGHSQSADQNNDEQE